MYYSNEYFAHLGGVSILELNEMEMTLLEILDFDIIVNMEEYTTYQTAVD